MIMSLKQLINVFRKCEAIRLYNFVHLYIVI